MNAIIPVQRRVGVAGAAARHASRPDRPADAGGHRRDRGPTARADRGTPRPGRRRDSHDGGVEWGIVRIGQAHLHGLL